MLKNVSWLLFKGCGTLEICHLCYFTYHTRDTTNSRSVKSKRLILG